LLGIFGVLGLAAGAVTYYLAGLTPAHAEKIETCAGFLLIGGFALLGAGLPCVLVFCEN
jgi:hypothetical protein